MTTRAGEKADPSKMDDHFPLWIGLISIAAVYGLFLLFEKVSKNEIDNPGAELPVPGAEYTDNPFVNDASPVDQTPQY